MSEETQNHGEWVAIENERRTKQYHANAIEALYGGNDDFLQAGFDVIYQAGRTAKALELCIEAQEAVIASAK